MGEAPGVDEVVLRTPDARFESLEDFAFAPNYATVVAPGCQPMRMHYLDEGDSEGPVVLLVHGQPTWSYLWRHTISPLVGAGARVIAPDHIGFGRSDKPRGRRPYTLRNHVSWLADLVRQLDLERITLVVHDWGGPIGLGALTTMPERVAQVVATNTAIHTVEERWSTLLGWPNHAAGDGRVVIDENLLGYVAFCARTPLIVPSLFVGAVSGPISEGAARGYDAPFPDEASNQGPHQMTALIPLSPGDEGAQINRASLDAIRAGAIPLHTVFSDDDPATAGWDQVLASLVPPHEGAVRTRLHGGGHFLPEQHGPELAAIIASLLG